MGGRGHTVHLLDAEVGNDLADIGHRIAVLGSNERWTTFVPTEASTFDDGHASKRLGRTLVHVWFDDDVGVSVRVYASGDFVGELSLPGDESDRAFTKTLEELGILSREQRAALLERMSDAAKLRAWSMEHGLEKLLELPFYDPMPTDERDLLQRLPKAATVLETKKATKASKATRAKARTPKTSEPLAPAKESWTEEDEAILDLHREYWATVFSMNNWKLYNRYKKHLPSDQRRDVDQLCSAVAMGDGDQLHQLTKSILARIWSCEDWDVVIRDPALIDNEGDVWDEWQARVSSSRACTR